MDGLEMVQPLYIGILVLVTLLQNGYIRCECHVISSRCTKRHLSGVIWNVIVNGTTTNETAVMQTKKEGSDESWKDEMNCNNSVEYKQDIFTMQCELEKNILRLLYDMQIVIRNHLSKEEKVIYEKKYLYQNGFDCFPHHEIHNLTVYDVTAHSVNISWSFSKWDIIENYIASAKIIVKDAGHEISRYRIDFYKQIDWTYHIQELNSCTGYSITVLIVYYTIIYREKRNSTVFVTTNCPQESPPVHELFILVSSLLFLLLLICLLSYFLYQRRIRRTRHETDEIIDQELLFKVNPRQIVSLGRSDEIIPRSSVE